VNELLTAVESWRALGTVLVVFGAAPGLALRLLLLLLPSDDSRRKELLGEFYAVPHVKRPLWVASLVELVVWEGLGERIHRVLCGRVMHRWELESGVVMNAQHPDTFWIPSALEKATIAPGVYVKAMFTSCGWTERMWVEVRSVKGSTIVGRLSNVPAAMPYSLRAGSKVKLGFDEVINIDPLPDAHPVIDEA
jgi:hypothetical protein